MTTTTDIRPIPGATADAAWLPFATTLIHKFEGCELAAYPDPATGADPWTIGWGATGEGIMDGVAWTQSQCDRRLEHDLAASAAGVDHLLAGKATNPHQKGALVSFAYNLGLGNLGSSTLLKKHKAGDFPGAAAEFGRWNKAAGKVMNGLTRRRAAEAAVYRGE